MGLHAPEQYVSVCLGLFSHEKNNIRQDEAFRHFPPLTILSYYLIKL